MFSIIGITRRSKYPRYPFLRESPLGTPLIISWFWISKVLSHNRVTRTAACEWVCIHAPASRSLRLAPASMAKSTYMQIRIMVCMRTV